MKTTTIITASIAGAIFLASCGGATNKTETKTEEVEESHEGHEHNEDMAQEKMGNEMPGVPNGAKVMFANLEDGAEVTSPVKIEFGTEGIEVVPAGEVVDGTGHHHIIIDGGPIPKGDIVPADETNIHYGQGQKETEIELAPGEHTLTLQFADGIHRSYGPDLSATISITVTE